MCNYITTNEEIEEAEKDIFENGEHFNDEQKNFLKCLDSCCVQAYAGTGKTSTIVGKLHILAQKNVWQNGRGICVISHTNVAVDEIKKHVAKHYPAIMQYPNFIGTIQEFVNKFLFIPHLSNKGFQIKFQDESRYLNFDNFPLVKDRMNKYRNSINRLSNTNRDQQLKHFNEAIYGSFITDGNVSIIDNGKTIAFLDNFIKLPTRNCNKIAILDALNTCILERQSTGSFLFCESFIDGLKYIKQNPILKDSISQRFQFVFLDEAQDCSEIQLNILNELFNDNLKTVFQQIGDINQAISETKWLPSKNHLSLSKSTRFGNNISEFINQFQVGTGVGVSGITKDTEKYLITYDLGAEKKVLKKFAEIIKSKNITTDKDFFAISHKHEQLSIYFSNYSEKIAKNKNRKTSYRFDVDVEYINLLTKEFIQQQGSNFVSKILLSLLFKYFKVSGHSWSELKDNLRTSGKIYDFKKLVVELCNDILKNNKISDLDNLKKRLNIILGENKIDFTNNGGLGVVALITNQVNENNFDYDGIKINVGTIHSVKGQTHNATLYFSNKEHKKQDIQHSLDNTAIQTLKYKKLLYVASSRSKYLFAFAIENSAYNYLTDKTMFQDFKKI